MREYKTLKVDTAFPDYGSKQLIELLKNGWVIKDKSIMKDRYIFYVLEKFNDPDIDKCSYGSEPNEE
jgi:hypothetical protein